MKFIADFHIHSRFSRATSKLLNPVHLDYWAKIKGVNVVGTGDFTHPTWTQELKQYLEPAEPGLLKLKKEYELENPVANPSPVRFLLTSEISNIYKKNGKVRKVHNVILAPDFETVEKVQKELDRRNFNIVSDGRPILGMDARNLLEMLLDIDQRIVFIPAHIWTPWFAVLGSKSGFDSIDECFEDMTQYIFAVETGLSSDLPMNWICSFLDRFNLISNSDAHSPEKLGRNANIFDTQMSYFDIIEALRDQNSKEFIGTIDLYPQEGKYHYDGHRKCGVRFDPVQTLEHGGICPVCGKPLTLGVAHRVASLADRDDPLERPIRKQFNYIIPLKEILGELSGTSSTTKKVSAQYTKIISTIGSETHILLSADLNDIRKHGGELLSEAIRRMRSGQVIIKEGFDGQYGVIKLFGDGELQSLGNQALFDINKKRETYSQRPLLNFDVARFRQLKKDYNLKQNLQNSANITKDINKEQKQAIEHIGGAALVIAGPGTGKTYTLTQRIAWLINNQGILPEKILAITFTNQATREMISRLDKILGQKSNKLTVKTFHALGYSILTEHYPNRKFIILTDSDKQEILSLLGVKKQQIRKALRYISSQKSYNNIEQDEEMDKISGKYNHYLDKNDLLDFDDLIYKTIQVLEQEKDLLNSLKQRWQYIHIDEFQDINLAQYRLIQLLYEGSESDIFAIGDPNQAIYGFRGADKSIIDRFTNDYKPKIYTINTSYRVPQNILDASKDVLGSSQALRGLQQGVKIKISNHASDKAEAEYIARETEKLIGGLRFFSLDSKVTESATETNVTSLSEIAILVRTRHQFPAIIKALNDHTIPYQIVGDKPFFKQEPFTEFIDYLRFILHPENQFLSTKVGDFRLTLQSVDKTQDPASIITQIAQTVRFEHPDLDRLKDMAKKFKTLSGFVESLELSDIQDDYLAESESIRLLTLHASKGLEFEAIFIAGVEKGLIPYTIYQSKTNIDEERRLLYVGMTRAKKFLFLTYAKHRKLLNREWNLPMSPFLKDIKKELLELEKPTYKAKPDDKQLRLF